MRGKILRTEKSSASQRWVTGGDGDDGGGGEDEKTQPGNRVLGCSKISPKVLLQNSVSSPSAESSSKGRQQTEGHCFFTVAV